MSKVKCKICGKPQGRITVAHLKTHDVTMDQYKEMPDFEEIEEMENLDVEPAGNTKVTPETMEDRIWGEDRKKDPNRPLQEFLDEFGVTEREAREVLRKFTKGTRIDPVVQARNFDRIGNAGADELKDKDKVETSNLHIAEKLQTNYGFICTDVIGAKGTKPKTWVLIKQ